MIGQLKGELLNVEDHFVLIDVSGVGYEVEMTANAIAALPTIGSTALVPTHFVVREDAQLLYGFATRLERDLFRALIRINSVGPKLALSLLSAMSLKDFAMIISSGDVAALTKVPGVGRKTAERLLVELKGKFDHLANPRLVEVNSVALPSVARSNAIDAEDALITLGYKPAEAARLVQKVGQRGDDEATESIVRRVLANIAQHLEVAP